MFLLIDKGVRYDEYASHSNSKNIAYRCDRVRSLAFSPRKEPESMIKLILQTLATFVSGALLLGLLLFLPAGTFNYWQAWVFIVVFLAA
jgi:hypothetical protein